MTVPTEKRETLKEALRTRVANEHGHLSPKSVQAIVHTMLRGIGDEGYTLASVVPASRQKAQKAVAAAATAAAAPAPATTTVTTTVTTPKTSTFYKPSGPNTVQAADIREDGSTFPVRRVVAPQERRFTATPKWQRNAAGPVATVPADVDLDALTDAEWGEYLEALDRDNPHRDDYATASDAAYEDDTEYAGWWGDVLDKMEPTDEELTAIDNEPDAPAAPATTKPIPAPPAKLVTTKTGAKVAAPTPVPQIELPKIKDPYTFTVTYMAGDEIESATFAGAWLEDYQIGDTTFIDFQHSTGETSFMVPTDKVLTVKQVDKLGAVKRVDAEVTE